jgi:2-C-methyl-D-erythritol 4-phosphate cytidylyltransferase
VLAAGSGTRVGAGSNKVLLPLAGVPVLAWSLRHVQAMGYVDRVVVVHREAERDDVAACVAEHCPGLRPTYVAGGTTRHASEWNALQALTKPIDDGLLDVVAIHDAARPLAGTALFDAVVAGAAEHGGALPVREQPGLLSRERGAVHGLVAVQTPQAFRARPLLDAYRNAERDGFTGTDTASCVERYTDLTVRGVDAPATNLKVTFREDVALAERLVARVER